MYPRRHAPIHSQRPRREDAGAAHLVRVGVRVRVRVRVRARGGGRGRGRDPDAGAAHVEVLHTPTERAECRPRLTLGVPPGVVKGAVRVCVVGGWDEGVW